MKENFQKMADRMANKIAVANIYVKTYENKRECPFYSEWKGMEQALKAMGIDFEYDFNDDIEIVAVTVMGQRAEV